MWHSKRAVDPVAVTYLYFVVGWLTVLVMAPITKVVRTKAMPQSNRATVLAFPVDFFSAVLFTIVHICSESLDLTVFADEVLLAGPLLHTKVGLTVDHASKVHLAALEALVEGT